MQLENIFGIARDDEDATFDIISRAISQSDVVLITGGVSMGDFDFVPSVLEKSRSEDTFFKSKYSARKTDNFWYS